jgi:hypothetical protein
MPDKHRKTLPEEVADIVAGKRRKVPVNLSLDPKLIRDVRVVLDRDGLSLSAHVARLLRDHLDQRGDAKVASRRGG